MKNNHRPPNTELPPHSLEAERGVLGCLMVAADSAEDWENAIGVVINKLGPAGAQFYDLRHRELFRTIVELDGEGKRPDAILILTRLRDKNQLESVGGPAYLSALSNGIASVLQAADYAAEVSGKYKLRRGLQVAGIHSERMMSATDAESALECFEEDVLKLSEESDETGIRSMADLVPPALAAIETAYEHRNQGLPIGIGTTWGYFNKMTSGFHPREVFVVGGESSIGKTSFMLNIALQVAMTDTAVGILSAESAAHELTGRLLAILGKADFFQIKSGHVSTNDLDKVRRAAAILRLAPIHIEDKQGMTPLDIRLKSRRLVSRYGCKLLILDHIHECTAPEARGDTKLEGRLLMEACRWAARHFNVPVIVLAQLHREAQKEMAKSKRRRPMKSDIRESGYIEQMADNVGILYRDREEIERMEQEGKDVKELWPVNLEICKQRNGPTGRCEFLFRRKSFLYEDRYANTGSVVNAAKKTAGQPKAEKESTADTDEFDL